MNRKQKIVLWIGIAIAVLMGLFPPWILHGENWTVSGYVFIFRLRPVVEKSWLYCHSDGRLDVGRLFAQWIMVAAITGALIVTFKDKKPKDD